MDIAGFAGQYTDFALGTVLPAAVNIGFAVLVIDYIGYFAVVHHIGSGLHHTDFELGFGVVAGH